MVHTDPITDQILNWAMTAAGVMVAAIGYNFYTRLNRHSVRMAAMQQAASDHIKALEATHIERHKEHAERMGQYETAAAVREQILMTLVETMGKMEAALLSHMAHEEKSDDDIKQSIHAIELSMVSMSRDIALAKLNIVGIHKDE